MKPNGFFVGSLDPAIFVLKVRRRVVCGGSSWSISDGFTSYGLEFRLEDMVSNDRFWVL